MAKYDVKSDLPAHKPGTPKGEERVRREGREPGREDTRLGRVGRDSTSINPQAHDPINAQMPHLPPA
jgi:hypothetical protein